MGVTADLCAVPGTQWGQICADLWNEGRVGECRVEVSEGCDVLMDAPYRDWRRACVSLCRPWAAVLRQDCLTRCHGSLPCLPPPRAPSALTMSPKASEAAQAGRKLSNKAGGAGWSHASTQLGSRHCSNGILHFCVGPACWAWDTGEGQAWNHCAVGHPPGVLPPGPVRGAA